MPKFTPIVVLTPVRNEGWCLRGFLECASLWADAILISDQSDGNEVTYLASEFPKVQVIRNTSSEFNEMENRSNLLAEGRKRYGRSVFISLDADERLTSNILDLDLQNQLRNLEPGVAVSIPFLNLKSGSEGWIVPLDPICFSDDGRQPENSSPIHFPRSCFSSFKKVVDLGLMTMHLQYLDSDRFKSKMHWYKCLEIVRFGERNPIALFRRYRHLDAISEKEIVTLEAEWAQGYIFGGVDPFRIEHSKSYWWEREADKLFELLTLESQALLKSIDSEQNPQDRKLPIMQAIIFKYLRLTMPFYKGGRKSIIFIALYALDLILSLFTRRFEIRGS